MAVPDDYPRHLYSRMLASRLHAPIEIASYTILAMATVSIADKKLQRIYGTYLIFTVLFILFEELYLRRWLYRHLGSSSVIAGSLPNFLSVLVFSFAIAFLTLPHNHRKALRTVLSVLTGLILYEIAQIWMPHRVFDWNDIAATLLGGIVAWLAVCAPAFWRALRQTELP